MNDDYDDATITNQSSSNQPAKPPPTGKKWLFISGVAVILVVAIAFFATMTNMTKVGIWKTMSNNLITNTSIAGVEVIGRPIQEVKKHINPALTWEDDYCFSIKNGEIILLEFYYDIGAIIDILRLFSTVHWKQQKDYVLAVLQAIF